MGPRAIQQPTHPEGSACALFTQIQPFNLEQSLPHLIEIWPSLPQLPINGQLADTQGD